MTFKPNRNLERELARDIKILRMCKDAADDAVADAKAHAPVESGEMRDTIRSEMGTHDGQPAAFFKIGGRKGWYWIFKEFGTSRQPATPFVRPALVKALAKRGGRLGER